jgi:hypothetical protein
MLFSQFSALGMEFQSSRPYRQGDRVVPQSGSTFVESASKKKISDFNNTNPDDRQSQGCSSTYKKVGGCYSQKNFQHYVARCL